jgi:hypothetical protein
MNNPESLDSFIDSMRTGEVDAEEFSAMERRLRDDPAFRRQYRERMRMEANLLSNFQAARPDIVPPLMAGPMPRSTRRRWIPTIAAGIAAALAIGFLIGSVRDAQDSPPVVAHLESSSEAAWLSGSPGSPGTGLSAGTLELQSGLAEIRFTSGVLLSLQGPARLEIIDPMRCRLDQGVAVVDVPDSGIGFIVETADGHAVDHGTRFAVSVGADRGDADFEVLEGSISVHHSGSGSVLPLSDAQAARLSEDGIQTLDTLPSATIKRSWRPDIVRLQTKGRETCILRNSSASKLDKTLDPDFLMIKMDVTSYDSTGEQLAQRARDRRSLIGFELGETELGKIENARLRLNLVPTGLGYASSLPETCTFQVYGVQDDPKLEAWQTKGLRWEDAPGCFKEAPQGNAKADGKLDLDEVRLLGSIDLPRGKVTGSVIFETPELTTFLREDSTGQVSFLLVRATPPREGWSLVHAFASSTHPDASGPTLELEMTGQPEE